MHTLKCTDWLWLPVIAVMGWSAIMCGATASAVWFRYDYSPNFYLSVTRKLFMTHASIQISSAGQQRKSLRDLERSGNQCCLMYALTEKRVLIYSMLSTVIIRLHYFPPQYTIYIISIDILYPCTVSPGWMDTCVLLEEDKTSHRSHTSYKKPSFMLIFNNICTSVVQTASSVYIFISMDAQGQITCLHLPFNYKAELVSNVSRHTEGFYSWCSTISGHEGELGICGRYGASRPLIPSLLCLLLKT